MVERRRSACELPPAWFLLALSVIGALLTAAASTPLALIPVALRLAPRRQQTLEERTRDADDVLHAAFVTRALATHASRTCSSPSRWTRVRSRVVRLPRRRASADAHLKAAGARCCLLLPLQLITEYELVSEHCHSFL